MLAPRTSTTTATTWPPVSMAGPRVCAPIDANGNLTSDGARTLEWDARNQLVAVNVGTHRTEFSYDGVQRRVRVIEKESGFTESDTRSIWCDEVMCEDRAADGVTLMRRSFTHGEQVSGAARLFTSDHLGNVTEVTVDGGLNARYAFDPWGRRALVSGTDTSVVGFTGHRAVAGDWVSWFRTLDSETGRWLNEDPGVKFAFSGGLAALPDGPNLFVYARNNPLRYTDPLGLKGEAPPQSLLNKIVQRCIGGAGTAGSALAGALTVALMQCGDGCADSDSEKKKNRNICQRLLALCLGDPWQPPHRQKEWGKKKDCMGCFLECKNDNGAWPFYKCPLGKER